MFQFFPTFNVACVVFIEPAIDVVVFYAATDDGLVNGAFEDRQCMLTSDRDVSKAKCLRFLL